MHQCRPAVTNRSTNPNPLPRTLPSVRLPAFVPLRALLLQKFDENNRPRVLGSNMRRLRGAVAIQKWSRDAKVRADIAAASSLKCRILQSLRASGAFTVAARLRLSRADEYAKRTLMVAGWRALHDHPVEKKV